MSRSCTIALVSLVLVALALGQVPYTLLDQSPSRAKGPDASLGVNDVTPQIETSEIESQPQISNSVSNLRVLKVLGEILPGTKILVTLTSVRNALSPFAATLGVLVVQTGTRLLI